MKIIQASFLWQSDKPGGLGFTFGIPGFDSKDLEQMFNGPILKQYLKDSDSMLGTIELYLAQLTAIGQEKLAGKEIPLEKAILASYNIVWLKERGFIPNDEFNGYQFITTP